MAKHAPRLQEYLASAQGRIRGDLAKDQRLPSANSHDLRLTQAQRNVDRRIWLRTTLPLNLLLLVPGLFFIGTRSSSVLFLWIASFPLVLVFRAILARMLSAWIGSREVLVRRELEQLTLDASSRASQGPRDDRSPHSQTPES